MEKKVDPGLFVNDGSFMEKFKQMQQEVQKKEASTKPKLAASSPPSGVAKPSSISSKATRDSRPAESPKSVGSSSNGKLAFSLKQKSKVPAPSIKLGADEEEEGSDAKDNLSGVSAKRQKLEQPEALESSTVPGVVAPSPPSDPSVKKVADRLANFVAKNGRQFENVTRQRNPGDTPFKFLFDSSCPDYKYYEYQLAEEEKSLSLSKVTQSSSAATSSGSYRTTSSSLRSSVQQSNYHTPASALYDSSGDGRVSPSANTSVGNNASYGETSAPPGADPIAMMEYYMKKAAQEERKRPPKQSKDEMPPPASLQAPVKKGHHMGDYIPPEELDKFLATCNDAAAQQAAREAAENAKIQADNVGHKLLSKMGWKEGEGLGSSKSGRADPVLAGNMKLNNLGVGAEQPGEVTPDDDIYEQYKKRMMLGYRHRPNPLNNPRKAYY